MKSGAQTRYLLGVVFLSILLISVTIQAETGKFFVGSRACEECHVDQYASFIKYASKSHSFESVTIMRKGLTDSEYKECLKCHSTGYGRPGGFVSENETPDLKNAGCEVCHGPGSVHADTQDPDDIIGEVSLDSCKTCHVPERISEFRYKPLLHGGAH